MLKTSGRSNGHDRLGTLNNCAGGLTPWGTVRDRRRELQPVLRQRRTSAGGRSDARAHERYGLPAGASERLWENFYPASTSRRSQTSRSASAGWSRSTRTMPPRPRRSGRRSAASSTKPSTCGRAERQGRRLHRRRRALRLRLQVRHQGPTTRTTAPPTWTC